MLPALGYANTQFAFEPAEMRLSLTEYAQLRGRRLCAIYLEEPSDLPDTFRRLVEHADRLRIRMIVVPSLHHLAALGDPSAVRRHLEYLIGGEVAVAADRPPNDGADVLIPASASALSSTSGLAPDVTGSRPRLSPP
ncbi:hypothetical protein ACFVWG_01715 [Kribbella sp. NPDC058245]|uniref:hypothetical protein n=1 Tax=Kribbella sp. NPDC058245 TaxID=3346399 RepID=UPI0036EF1A0A